MKALYLLLALVCLAGAQALQFTAPNGGATYTSPASVGFTWDEPATLTITGAVHATNTTNATVNLTTGNYTAVITNENGTANISITVNAPVTQTITVTADKAVYEVGTAARITVATTTPGQLTLTAYRNGAVADTYTITVQQQTDFLYTLLTVGNYTITVTGQGATATTAFTAQNSTLGVTVTGSSTATAGRLASFSAQASGGTGPYTYNWQFSDNTTSTGATTDHVFSTNGTYNVTVIAQDATAKQASAKLTVTVEQELYRIDVSVLGDNNKLLKDAVVVLTGISGGKTQKTDTFGETRFRNLSAGNYTINATYNDTAASPAVMYTETVSIMLTKNENVAITLQVPDPTAAPPAQNTTSTTTNQSVTSEVTTAAEPQQAALATAPVEAPLTQEELAAQAFEKVRSEKLNELHTMQTTMLRSEEKEQLLGTLGLLDTYGAAQKAMEQSATEYELVSSLSAVPKEVVIAAKDTAIVQQKYDDVAESVDLFFEERGIADTAEQRKYRYNIEETLKQTTITAKRTVVYVTTYGGKETAYTIFHRDIQAPEGTTFIEVIPKKVARDASELTVDGSHEVLVADPVIRFLTPTYHYYVAEEAAGNIVILPVPPVFAEPPSIIGFVAVKLKLNSFDRGGLYLIIIGTCFAVALLGNVYLRGRNGSAVPAFADLADMTFMEIEKGNYALAAKYLKEVEAIHATLKPAEKEQTKDILQFFRHAAAVHEFRTSAEHVHNLLALNDTVAVSTAYERAMQHYEALPEEFQEKEKHVLEKINHALEQHLVAVEGTQ